MTETVLVTGGTGFIAQWCLVELLRQGYDVRTTVRDAGRGDAVRAAVDGELGAPSTIEVHQADLLADDGWADALEGCRFVLHVASPMGRDGAEDPDELIVPARDGVRRVLRAAVAAGVERVVMTSAANTASPTSYEEDSVTDEELWTDLTAPDLPAYRQSKTIAEREAWAFMESSSGATELTTVLPGAVFGPVLTPDNLGSVTVISRMLTGQMAGLPRIGLEVVDVRDLVDLHLRAMTAPAAGGERFLGTGAFLWMAEIAAVLRDGLGAAAARVPTDEIPDDVMRELARSMPELRGIMPGLGRKNRHSTAKADGLLDWGRRPPADTILDCARSLIAHGVAG